jgi:hypothetical protein
MTTAIADREDTQAESSSRGMCSVCGQAVLPGQLIQLDSRQYDPLRQGHDWTWHHAGCREHLRKG